MSPRILVVDDEPVLAYALAAMLEQDGFAVVGPAADVSQALSLIATEGCDAAILDVVLREGTSAPVAEALRRLGKPFLVLSGDVEDLPAGFAGATALSKPVRADVLLSELRNSCPPLDPIASAP